MLRLVCLLRRSVAETDHVFLLYCTSGASDTNLLDSTMFYFHVFILDSLVSRADSVYEYFCTSHLVEATDTTGLEYDKGGTVEVERGGVILAQ